MSLRFQVPSFLVVVSGLFLVLSSCDKAGERSPTIPAEDSIGEVLNVVEEDGSSGGEASIRIRKLPKPDGRAPMLSWINYHRTNGATCPDGTKMPPVPALKPNFKLKKAAMAYSSDQAKYRFDGRFGIFPSHCSHKGVSIKSPNSQGYRCKSDEFPDDRARTAGYPYGVFELIAVPYASDVPRVALQQTIFGKILPLRVSAAKTTERCKQFMDPRLKFVGIAKIDGKSPTGSRQPWRKHSYYTMMFGPLPKSVWVKPAWEN